MDLQTRKLNFIEEFLHLNNEKLLDKLEKLLKLEKPKEKNKISVYDVMGVISKEEGDYMQHVIEENCEKINQDDWK